MKKELIILICFYCSTIYGQKVFDKELTIYSIDFVNLESKKYLTSYSFTRCDSLFLFGDGTEHLIKWDCLSDTIISLAHQKDAFKAKETIKSFLLEFQKKKEGSFWIDFGNKNYAIIYSTIVKGANIYIYNCNFQSELNSYNINKSFFILGYKEKPVKRKVIDSDDLMEILTYFSPAPASVPQDTCGN